jgi:hypothetical protein
MLNAAFDGDIWAKRVSTERNPPSARDPKVFAPS